MKIDKNPKQVAMHGKLGQFEIMGLAFLIIIIILGFTMFLLLDSEPKENKVASFERDQLAQTTVDVLLRTDAGPDCQASEKATLYDLVRDITILHYGICDLTPRLPPDLPEQTSIDILESAVIAIIGNSTPSRYNFTIYLESDPANPVLKVANCPATTRSFDRTGEQRIRLLPYPETAIVELRLCPFE